jgi:tetratricopeptide (TPR) repeat protein
VDELLECLASETAADSAVAETIALALERIWRQDMGARNESRLDEAEGLLEDGLTDEALALADLLAREAAGHAEIHGLRGRVRLEMGCYEAAVVDFREAAALNPRHWPSLRAWGRAALDRNDNTGAVEPLRALTEAFPSDRDLREELGRVLRSPEYSREEGQASWDLQSEIGSSGTERSAN